ncbi:hypothetical protein N431DRAFT_69487 [Stipitochalara longipes BDJ]|nr:hypothetical protein N431DRAFT_69487 [Stipitochalara longipes BDJ]
MLLRLCQPSCPYFVTGSACPRRPQPSMNHAEQSRRRRPSIGLYCSNPTKGDVLCSAYLRGPILMQLLRGLQRQRGRHTACKRASREPSKQPADNVAATKHSIGLLLGRF